jgi:hypothetical protein
MPGISPAQTNEFYSTLRTLPVFSNKGLDRWQRLASSAIIVLGSPRSGTSWLAKIFDSHPDILYRHEPDELTSPRPGLSPSDQVAEWVRQRGLRAAVKRPNFQKSWRPPALDAARTTIAAALSAAQKLPPLSSAAGRIGVPDLVMPRQWNSVRAAVKLVNWDGNGAARSMPDSRFIFILRHPCGQIASLIAGHAASRFAHSTDSSGHAIEMKAAALRAERDGIDRATFDDLPIAARLAWCWVAFNEPAVASFETLPNARIVIYESLCRDPEASARELFAFAGLDWHKQTDAFLQTSTRHDRPSGYFDVFRSTNLVADRWRQSMSQQDQDAVRSVVSRSSLCRCWPDLAPEAI